MVVGAHYDHLGLGDENSLAPSQIGQIHHGADDNASGTAGVLEFARLASLHKQAFKRSILFMTFAGEEKGLLGSNYFVNHPTVPLSSIVGMINMDMIGRVNNNHVNVLGVGTSPEFKSWIEEFNKTVGLQINFSASGHEGSDHISFNGKHIPILFFFSGLHSRLSPANGHIGQDQQRRRHIGARLWWQCPPNGWQTSQHDRHTPKSLMNDPQMLESAAILKWIRTVFRIGSRFP